MQFHRTRLKEPRCDKHDRTLDKNGKCWSCLFADVQKTRRRLTRSLTPRQRRLFRRYGQAVDEKTSAIILD